MTLKLIILAIIFVLTSGAFFTDYFKQHKLLVLLAGIMAIISSLFLLQDIISSIKDDVVADLNTNDTQNHSQQNSFQVQLEREQQEKAALQAQLEASKKLEQELQEKAALKAELEALKKQREQEQQEKAALEAKLKLEQEQQEKAALQAQLEKLEQEQQEKAALQAQLEALKKKNEFMPGKVFRDRLADGSFGPEMVVIPAGTFSMGDIQGGGQSDEQPVHEVSVGKFAMGKFEVTVAEFRKFVNAKNYKTDAEKQGSCWTYENGWKNVKGANWRNTKFSQNDNHPVVCVSWNDATAYAKWLSDQTGKTYRLPTEAEWEYAARAGTTTKYWWGNEIDKSKANYGRNIGKTSPVGNYKANKFGLYDTSGNVWEWTCSEYTDKYTGKEKACIANNTNKNRVLRGGSWYGIPSNLRSAIRDWGTPDFRFVSLGFRLVVLRAAWIK